MSPTLPCLITDGAMVVSSPSLFARLLLEWSLVSTLANLKLTTFCMRCHTIYTSTIDVTLVLRLKESRNQLLLAMRGGKYFGVIPSLPACSQLSAIQTPQVGS